MALTTLAFHCSCPCINFFSLTDFINNRLPILEVTIDNFQSYGIKEIVAFALTSWIIVLVEIKLPDHEVIQAMVEKT
jgi:hypothetical protein